MELSEVEARLLDFETMAFLAFSSDLFRMFNIYATEWQCHDLEMDTVCRAVWDLGPCSV